MGVCVNQRRNNRTSGQIHPARPGRNLDLIPSSDAKKLILLDENNGIFYRLTTISHNYQSTFERAHGRLRYHLRILLLRRGTTEPNDPTNNHKLPDPSIRIAHNSPHNFPFVPIASTDRQLAGTNSHHGIQYVHLQAPLRMQEAWPVCLYSVAIVLDSATIRHTHCHSDSNRQFQD